MDEGQKELVTSWIAERHESGEACPMTTTQVLADLFKR
jgi:hypothetical protein